MVPPPKPVVANAADADANAADGRDPCDDADDEADNDPARGRGG